MEKHIFRLIRYAIVIFPILFLIFLLTNMHPYVNKNSLAIARHSTAQQAPRTSLSVSRLQDMIEFKGAKNTAKQITNQHQWNTIIQEIATGNKEWITFIPSILPYIPFHIKNEFNQAMRQALLKKPRITLHSLALTHLTIKNTKAICSAPTLTQYAKQDLAKILQSVHNPFVIYQQKSCLQALLKAGQSKQINMS